MIEQRVSEVAERVGVARGALRCWRFGIGSYFGAEKRVMSNVASTESHGGQWLTTIASLAVGAPFFAVWFRRLPGWLGFNVAAVGEAPRRWVCAVAAVRGFARARGGTCGFGRTGTRSPC